MRIDFVISWMANLFPIPVIYEKAEIMIVNEVVLEVPVQDDIRQESDSNTNHPVDEILSSIAIFVIISFSFFKNTHRLIDLFLILASVWGEFLRRKN